MTTTIVYADANDAYLESHSTDFTTAQNGANLAIGDSSVFHNGIYGLNLVGGDRYVFETFLKFPYSKPTNEVALSAQVGVLHLFHAANLVGRDLQFYFFPYGTVSTADWKTPNDFAVTAHAAVIAEAQASGTSVYTFGSSDELVQTLAVNGTQDVELVAINSRQAAYGSGPSGDETSQFWLSESAFDPVMVVTSAPESTLRGVLGAQVRVSDGTHLVLESDGAATPTVTLRHVDLNGTATTKATIPTGTTSATFAFEQARGPQQLALIVDSSNNVYVVGRRGDSENTLAVLAYLKSFFSYTWTAGVLASGALPVHNGTLNNFAGAWHATANGTLVIFASHRSSYGSRPVNNEFVYAICGADAPRYGIGTFIRASNTAVNAFSTAIPAVTWTVNANDTGTGLDVTALPSNVTIYGEGKGAITTFSRWEGLGLEQPVTSARYTLNAAGTSITGAYDMQGYLYAQKTSATKLRAVPIDGDQFVAVGFDPHADYGLSLTAFRTAGSPNTMSVVGVEYLGSESLTTLPGSAANTMSESQAWDVAYHTADRKAWVYYFDQANNRRLMRTAVSLDTFSATREEVQVNAAVGASGSTNLALRVARGASTVDRTLVTVANRSAGGTLSTIYVADKVNLAPNAPALGPRSNFDASASAGFTWTFSDPNPGDTQGSYQLQVNSASTASTYFDSGRYDGTTDWVNAGVAASGNNVNVTPGLPSGITPGDLLVMQVSIRNSGTGTPTAPAGWRTFVDASNMRVFGKVAAANETAPTVTFSGGASGADTLAQVFAVRAHDPDISTVLTASAAQLNGSAQNINTIALVVPNAGSMVMRFAWKQDDWTTISTPGGYTLAGSVMSTAGSDAAQAAYYRILDVDNASLPAGSHTVTGGAAAISRSAAISLRPLLGASATNFTMPASTLPQPNALQFRVKTWDQTGLEGPWSGYQRFTTGPGATVTITDPATDNPADVHTASYLVAWTSIGAVQAEYRVVVKRTDTEAETYNSGWVTSVSTTHTATGFISDVEHRIEVTTRTALLVESNTGTRLLTPDFDTPDPPTIAVLADPDGGFIGITVTNPSVSGDRPTPIYTEVWRRPVDPGVEGDDWKLIGGVDASFGAALWRDYTAGGGVRYWYKARVVAQDGSFAESEDEVQATLNLVGFWIHDPTPSVAQFVEFLSSKNYDYGGPSKAIGYDSMGSGNYYAGRSYPVFDFGEHQSEVFGVTLQIPFGNSPSWWDDIVELRRFAEQRTTLCVRDGRGRVIFGTLAGYSETDERWGTSISFSVTRVDYDDTWGGIL